MRGEWHEDGQRLFFIYHLFTIYGNTTILNNKDNNNKDNNNNDNNNKDNKEESNVNGHINSNRISLSMLDIVYLQHKKLTVSTFQVHIV